jgi:hypothetical protein
MLTLPLIVWSILPLVYFVLLGWAVIKYLFKLNGNEPIQSYISQFVFCFFCWITAFVFINSVVYSKLSNFAIFSYFPENLIGWICYPFILFVFGFVSASWQKKSKDPRMKKTS